MAKKKLKSDVSFVKVLHQIGFELRMLKQHWSCNLYHSAAQSASGVESLIDLLEIEDCGSTGGFGDGSSQGIDDSSLFGRFEWLVEKYFPDGKSKIEDYAALKIFFKKRKRS